MIIGPSSVLEAMLRAGDVPDALSVFDSIATLGDDANVDFFELSARVSDQVQSHRATYYFDVARHGPQQVETANARFAAAADSCGFTLPAAFEEALSSNVFAHPSVLQIVLGIDATDDRIKHYLIFRGDPSRVMEALAEAVGIEVPRGVDPSAIYIAGVDFARGGPVDLKVYLRLQQDRVTATLRQPAAHAKLVAGSRYVVFQQRATSARRQMYFHATNPGVIERELTDHPASATPALRERIRTMNAGAKRRLEPWILAYPYADGALDRSRYTVYFHFAG